MLKLSDFDYDLPADRIAQTPLAQRDRSRLMVVHRDTGAIEDRVFIDLPSLLNAGDVLVINDTRVSALRLFGFRPGRAGERIEVFLTERLGAAKWTALVRPGKKMLPGQEIEFDDGLSAVVIDRTDDRGGRLLQFSAAGSDPELLIEALGQSPLPPYITTPLPRADRERYQTVYAKHEGSSAAPTAGLHFTPTVLESLASRGVTVVRVTLHVGLGTFRPIQVEDITEHKMHSERVQLTEEAAELINSAQGRVVAVGTTALRTLESAAAGPGRVRAMDGETDLYVTPGYRFQVAEALITNFHMPRSTLLVLVSAFAGQAAGGGETNTDGRKLIQTAYQHAIDLEYRFLSFGDAMFIV